jgi:two-component system sensor histidine kinase ChiS
VAIALAALLLALAAFATGCRSRAYGEFPAKAGSATYAPGEGPLFLVGEWELYDGIIDPATLDEAAHIPRFARADFRANPYRAAKPSVEPVTYRLRIGIAGPHSGEALADPRSAPGELPDSRRMALFIPGLAGFAVVYIDGAPVYHRVADPNPSPFILFETDADSVSVVLQSGPGGRRLEDASLMPSAILFGQAGEVNRFQVLALGAALFEVGYFVFIGLFTFLLFLFWRKNAEFLGFSLYMIAAGAFYAFKNAIVLQSIPSLSSLVATDDGVVELAYVAVLHLQYLALAFFLWTLYRSRAGKAISIVALAMPVALALAAFIASVAGAWQRELYLASLAYYGLFALAVLGWLIALVARGEERARWLLPAFGVASAAIVAKQFLSGSVASAFLLEPAGIVVFGFVCMLMLVKKVGDSFETVETLSDYVTSVTSTVRSFIPKEFLEYLDKADVVDLRLGDHVKKEMTIFFSDIRAFTELSERLTVEENFAFINSYLSRVVPIIRENGGFVDKYLGDGILALYPGAAGPDEAIRSAIAMQGKIQEYNGHRAKMGYCPIAMGVGIHTGALMLGVVGVSDRMENTVISDAVNLSSRLQAITKAFNIAVAISEQSFKELEDPGSYKYRFIGKVRVKGKAAPVSVFEIFDGIAPDLFERKMKANTFFEQGMLSYYQKDFAGAMYYFKRVLDIIPEDGAAGFYLDNCMNKAAI